MPLRGHDSMTRRLDTTSKVLINRGSPTHDNQTVGEGGGLSTPMESRAQRCLTEQGARAQGMTRQARRLGKRTQRGGDTMGGREGMAQNHHDMCQPTIEKGGGKEKCNEWER